MDKPANNDYPIHELILKRWSPRAFSNEPIDDETLCSILEAARWAPSSYNDQPWHFILARQEKSDQFNDLLDCLYDGNQSWAKNAPVLMLSVARTRFNHNGNSNRHALHDVGLAAENLVLQALDEGVYVHQMAGFDEDKARETYEIPTDHEPVAGFALGYPGDPTNLSEELREREQSKRNRKPLDEFVFSESWGNVADTVNST